MCPDAWEEIALSDDEEASTSVRMIVTLTISITAGSS